MIYIIGGNGFVGSAIARACERRNLPYQKITRENIDEFTDSACEILINANGNSKKFMSEREPLWDFDASVKSVRASLVNIKADKYIHISSCDVYPDCSSPEFTKEDQVIDVTKQSAYGFHKYLAELCVMRHAPKWIIFRMGGFVGEGLKKNAIYDILQGGPLWLDPESELQFIDVDKAADLIVDVAISQKSGEIYNICGKGTVRIGDVIALANKEVSIMPEAPRVRYEISIEKMQEILELPNTKEDVFEYVNESVR